MKGRGVEESKIVLMFLFNSEGRNRYRVILVVRIFVVLGRGRVYSLFFEGGVGFLRFRERGRWDFV